MAYRRSITARAKFFCQQQQRLSPSISYVHRDDNDCEELQMKPDSRNPEFRNYSHHRFFGAGNNLSNYRRSTSLLQDRRFTIPTGYESGMACDWNYSSSSVGEGTADQIEVLNDVAAPVVPTLQWASIVVSTLIIRSIQLPFLINQLKSTSKFNLLNPQLEAVREEMQNKGMSPSVVAEGQVKMKALYKEFNPKVGKFALHQKHPEAQAQQRQSLSSIDEASSKPIKSSLLNSS